MAFQATQITGDSNAKKGSDKVPKVLPTQLDILLLQELLFGCLHVQITNEMLSWGSTHKIYSVLCNCQCDKLLINGCEQTVRPPTIKLEAGGLAPDESKWTFSGPLQLLGVAFFVPIKKNRHSVAIRVLGTNLPVCVISLLELNMHYALLTASATVPSSSIEN